MMPPILFPRIPKALEVANGDIHVFCAPLDQPPQQLARLAQTLSEDESQRSGRFYFEKDRNRFIASRGLLREILGRLMGVHPAVPVFSVGEHGKPRLAGKTAPEHFLYFNVAHSDTLGVFAVSREHEVGVDIERVRPIHETEAIVERFFSVAEQRQWHGVPRDTKMTAFFNCWVRKEAILKARGEGIGRALKQTEVFWDGNQAPDGQFTVRSLSPALGHAAAVATNGRSPRLHCWAFTTI